MQTFPVRTISAIPPRRSPSCNQQGRWSHANAHPEKLDLERRPNRHIAFGTGIHFCLGHQLARIEGICALKALFRRWPKLQLAVDGSEIKWRRRPGLRAIEHLPVTVLVRANAPSARADAPADSAKPVH